MKQNAKRNVRLVLLLAILAPTAVYADGVSPILNFFHKDTWLPASIVTAVIILLESGLLRWRIEGIYFSGALWRSLLLNAASSLTGSVLLIAFSRDSFFMWDTMSLVLPLFLITLATEIPLLHFLFRTVPLSWQRAFVLGCGINIASYAAVFVLEIGLLFGWLSYAGHLDQKDLVKWNNPALLQQLSGRIYTTESVGTNYGLRVYDLQNACWSALTNCPAMDPNKWDVEGNTLAFVKSPTRDWKEDHLVVARLPAFTTLLELSPTAFSDSQFDNWQGVSEVSVSPDQKKVAFLFRLTDAIAPKDSSSHFALGSKCRLIVVDLQSGQETARANRWASDDGLCWLSDSRRVLFSSFDDESLYQSTKADVRGSVSYGTGYARDGRFKRSLCAFDVETGKTAHFADGYAPTLAPATGDILIRDENGLLLLNSSGKPKERIDVGALGFRGVVVSPSGDMVLADIRRRVSFFPGGRLVLVNTATPKVRHVVDDGHDSHYYRVDWTVEESRMSKHGSNRTPDPPRGSAAGAP